MKNSSQLIQKLWNYCSILRDDGMSYADYVEQLTYLLFLKMAEEHSKPPFLHLSPLDPCFDWQSLLKAQGREKLYVYEGILWHLSQREDLFGTIYKNALSRFRDPTKLRRLVAEMDAVEWTKFDSDIKGEAYEGLLEKTASDGKAGAGQYFTPRPLTDAITAVIRPVVGETICDPACGTGGFLLSAYREINRAHLSSRRKFRLSDDAIQGVELVDSVARLCLMNLVLHGIGGKKNPVHVGDSLEMKPDGKEGQLFDVVLANPPFGNKSSVGGNEEIDIVDGEDFVVDRDDFWATTNNKQLNFLQHIFTMLKPHGRAAVIVPDNVLFEGGAGETIRRALLENSDVHTLLRLPSGIFYAQGVRANVLFFERKSSNNTPSPGKLWIYDLRTNRHFTRKASPLAKSDLDDFVSSYCIENREQRKESERFKCFSYEDLRKRDKLNLDIFWIKDKTLEASSNLPEPTVVAQEISEELQAALQQFAAISVDLNDKSLGVQ